MQSGHPSRGSQLPDGKIYTQPPAEVPDADSDSPEPCMAPEVLQPCQLPPAEHSSKIKVYFTH